MFCFDIRNGPDYPVYYHHQDEPRAIIIESSEWDEGTPNEPDYASFSAWLDWLISSVEAGADPEELGQPTNSVLHFFEADGPR